MIEYVHDFTSLMCSIAAAQFFTLFLAHPNEALSELDRIPYEVSADPTCLVCHEDKPDVPALECERVS